MLVLPGWLTLELLGSARAGFERLGLAVGLSLALWPLALLWSTVAGVSWTAPFVRVAVLILAATGILVAVWRLRRGWPPSRPDLATWSMVAVLGITLVSRVWHVRGLVVPPWVDGYHHTLITRLITTAGGVPASFEPFLAVDRFFYHFGFHAAAAVVAWLSGQAEPVAVLWLGQALNVLTVPAAYLLARGLGARRLSAVLAASVPAALCWFPAYYVSWGRYTQLAALVMLPAVWVLIYDAVAPSERPGRTMGPALAAAICAAGLTLTHYRVTAVCALGVLVLLAGLALSRRLGRRAALSLGAMAIGAAALAGPWLVQVATVGVGTLRAASPTWYAGPPEVDNVPAWLFTVGANGALLRLAGLGLVAAMLLRRRGAWLAAVLLAATFLAVNPALTGLPPSWIVPRFAVAIAAWLPVAAGLAFLADTAAATYRPRPGGRPPLSGRTMTAGIVLAAAVGYAWVFRAVPPTETAMRDVVVLGALALALAGLAQGALPTPVPKRLRLVAAMAVVVLTLAGAWAMREVLNRSLVLAQAPDLRAAGWVRANTPSDARFLVRTGHWQLGTYRGLDGGYWLPLLAERATSMPAVFYNYGRLDYGLDVADQAREAARGDALSDQELAALMGRVGARYIYLGPAANDRDDTFGARRLDGVPWLRRIYDDGGVVIYGLRRNLGRGAPIGYDDPLR